MSATTPDRPTFAERQLAFAAHLRDPEAHPAPADVDPARMAVYRRLVFGNVSGLLASNFPVIRSLLAEAAWDALVRDFLRRHEARTPLFHRLGLELLAYLEGDRAPLPDEPPFLAELAHYEWVETELALSPEEPDLAGIRPDGDLLAEPLVLSPNARSLRYAYPVHRIGRDFQPTEPGERPTHLVVVRDAEDRVRFLEIAPMTAALLARIETAPELIGRDHLEALAVEAGGMSPEAVLQGGARALGALREREVILGTRRAAGDVRR